VLVFKLIYKDSKRCVYGNYLHGAEHEHNPNWKHGHFGLHVL